MPQTQFRRYAIYFTPPPGQLARFGAAWLGWDIVSGCAAPHPDDILGLPTAIADLTQKPRRYGLHATIKAPFRLHPATAPEALQDALVAFCTTRAPVSLAAVTLTRMGHFLALTAEGATTALDLLAADTVRQFDHFRAPPNDAEIARHQGPQFSEKQKANALRWGYPHVMDQFHWHMTLTGKCPPMHSAQIEASLALKLTPLLPRPFIIDALSLVGEDSESNFHLIHRAALSG